VFTLNALAAPELLDPVGDAVPEDPGALPEDGLPDPLDPHAANVATSATTPAIGANCALPVAFNVDGLSE
jgi:hypothetical protein